MAAEVHQRQMSTELHGTALPHGQSGLRIRIWKVGIRLVRSLSESAGAIGLQRIHRTPGTRLRIKSAELPGGFGYVVECLGEGCWSGQEGGMAAVDLDALHA